MLPQDTTNSFSEWSEPRPQRLPRSTYTPAVLALGIVLLFWGPVTTPIISGIGLTLSAVALAGWIGELRHERRNQEHAPRGRGEPEPYS